MLKIIPILKNLSGFYDVRTEIPKFIVGNTIIWNKASKWMEENYLLDSITIENDFFNKLSKPLSKINSVQPSTKNSVTNLINNFYTNKTIIYKNIDTEDNYEVDGSKLDDNFTTIYNNTENNVCSESIDLKNNYFTNLNNSNTSSKTKININIINGNYNKIVLADNTSLNKNKRDNSTGFSKIKNNFNYQTTKNSPKKVSLHYKKKNIIKNEEFLSNQNNSLYFTNNANGLMQSLHNSKDSFSLNQIVNNNSNVNFIPSSTKSGVNLKKNLSINLGQRNKIDIHKIKNNLSYFIKSSKETNKSKDHSTTFINQNQTMIHEKSEGSLQSKMNKETHYLRDNNKTRNVASQHKILDEAYKNDLIKKSLEISSNNFLKTQKNNNNTNNISSNLQEKINLLRNSTLQGSLLNKYKSNSKPKIVQNIQNNINNLHNQKLEDIKKLYANYKDSVYQNMLFSENKIQNVKSIGKSAISPVNQPKNTEKSNKNLIKVIKNDSLKSVSEKYLTKNYSTVGENVNVKNINTLMNTYLNNLNTYSTNANSNLSTIESRKPNKSIVKENNIMVKDKLRK